MAVFIADESGSDKSSTLILTETTFERIGQNHRKLFCFVLVLVLVCFLRQGVALCSLG